MPQFSSICYLLKKAKEQSMAALTAAWERLSAVPLAEEQEVGAPSTRLNIPNLHLYNTSCSIRIDN